VHVDAEQPANLAARQGRFGILDLRKDRLAASVVDLAFQRRCDVAGGPLQEPNAEPVLELLDRRGRVDRGTPRSDAAALKLCRSTTRTSRRMLSNLSNCSYFSNTDAKMIELFRFIDGLHQCPG
jgi:hypothetical protein